MSKKATIERMDNGYLLTLQSDRIDGETRWVENKLKKIFVHIEWFFGDGKGALKEEKP